MFAWFGLVALTPIGLLVYQGRMSASDAGMKAGIVLLAVFMAIRLTDFALSGVAAALEQRQPIPPPPDSR
jgi:hypothetical protein